METELTKRIKLLTHGWRPHMPTKMRTIRYADEVWTPTGIVDSIRFEDYIAEETILCNRIHYDLFPPGQQKILKDIFHIDRVLDCLRRPTEQPRSDLCAGCAHRNAAHKIGMLITCFEIKIALSDFRSKNGHNFHGHENYYVVPKDLTPKILDEVPEHIGIVEYINTERYEGLRIYKPCQRREVAVDIQVSLLYNALKKWCDGAQER